MISESPDLSCFILYKELGFFRMRLLNNWSKPTKCSSHIKGASVLLGLFQNENTRKRSKMRSFGWHSNSRMNGILFRAFRPRKWNEQNHYENGLFGRKEIQTSEKCSFHKKTWVGDTSLSSHEAKPFSEYSFFCLIIFQVIRYSHSVHSHSGIVPKEYTLRLGYFTSIVNSI